VSETPMRVGLLPHRDRELARDLARHAALWLSERGVTVRLAKPDADRIGLPDLGVDPQAFTDGLDVVISLGGDGSMLRAIDQSYEAGVAVLGVNVGQMGYLTEVEPSDLDAALALLLEGDYQIDERMVLSVHVESAGPAAGHWYGLNEAVVEKSRSGHMARLEVAINGAFFTTYAADGVIVATPTGSTAYSFSVGGPIVSPRLACLLMTPVSPHMLFDRTLVLDPSTTVRLDVGGDRPAAVAFDGRLGVLLQPGDAIICRAADVPARFVTFGEHNFHRVLRAKFGLNER